VKRVTKDFLKRVQRQADAIPTRQLKALAPALRAAYDELQKQLAKVLSEGKDDRFTAEQYRRALIQLSPVMDRITELAPKVSKALLDGDREARALAHDHLVQTFEHFQKHGGADGKGFASSLFPIPVKQAARVADRGLIDHYETSALRYSARVRQDIRLQLAKGMLKGESLDQMARRLAPKIAHSIDAGEAVGEALSRKYQFWAERIVRTEVLNAYNAETSDQHAAVICDNPDEDWLIQWSAALDARVCPVCKDLDGKPVKPTEDFPGGFRRPPAHPLCRCTSLLVAKSWLADTKKDA
jgi:SPP1 gp7 family putative phage head morphogenesis protein